MYAVWLTFSKNDSEYFSKIIKQLSSQYSSPKFVPHLTVYGLVNAPVKIIEESVLSLKKMKKFKVKNFDISHSPKLWKSVFCVIESNNKLALISSRLTEGLGEYTTYEFQPHVSLLYKKLIKTEREKIVADIKIKKLFLIDRIVIIKYFNKVEDWKIVKKYKLQ